MYSLFCVEFYLVRNVNRQIRHIAKIELFKHVQGSGSFLNRPNLFFTLLFETIFVTLGDIANKAIH